jgi:hypothetical protein
LPRLYSRSFSPAWAGLSARLRPELTIACKMLLLHY